jgi:hypothetical protein
MTPANYLCSLKKTLKTKTDFTLNPNHRLPVAEIRRINMFASSSFSLDRHDHIAVVGRLGHRVGP